MIQPPILIAENIYKYVNTSEGRLTLLENINFSIAPGESLAIIGRSGSGKSTLLGLLAGLDLPSQGRIILLDQELQQLDEDGRASLRAGQVGFVFQSFQLLPNFTALENVSLPLMLTHSHQAEEKAKALLNEVGLEKRYQHYPAQLSGGEQQRVALARAFAIQPKILFADEPTGSLDYKTGEKITQLLFKLQEEYQTTLILVTHEEKLAALCQHRLLLEAGQCQMLN